MLKYKYAKGCLSTNNLHPSSTKIIRLGRYTNNRRRLLRNKQDSNRGRRQISINKNTM